MLGGSHSAGPRETVPATQDPMFRLSLNSGNIPFEANIPSSNILYFLAARGGRPFFRDDGGAAVLPFLEDDPTEANESMLDCSASFLLFRPIPLMGHLPFSKMHISYSI